MNSFSFKGEENRDAQGQSARQQEGPEEKIPRRRSADRRKSKSEQKHEKAVGIK
jgi:hypothetical protein